MSEVIDKLIDDISALPLMEVAKLIEGLEEKLGVTAAAPVAMVAGAGAPAAGGGEAAEEKTEFDLSLDDAGAERVKVIKIVREVTGLGLKDAKEIVDSAPKVLKEGISKDEAEDFKKKLEEVGAKASLK